MASICLGLNVLTVCISYTCTSDRTIVKHANILFYFNEFLAHFACHVIKIQPLNSNHCIMQSRSNISAVLRNKDWYNAPFFILTAPQFPCTCAFHMEPTQLFPAESLQVNVRHANLCMALQLYNKMLQTLYLAGLVDILYGLAHAQGRL